MSHLWQGFTPLFGRLSVTSCLLFLLFLCSSVASRVSLPTHFLWILHGYSHCSGTQKLTLPDVGQIVQLSLIPSPICSQKFHVPRWRALVNVAEDWESVFHVSLILSALLSPGNSYDGDLASYLATTVVTLPFSCLGEEHPGVGPLYGEELLLEVGLCDRDKERGSGASGGIVRGSRSRSGGRRAGGNGNASGNPVM